MWEELSDLHGQRKVQVARRLQFLAPASRQVLCQTMKEVHGDMLAVWRAIT